MYSDADGPKRGGRPCRPQRRQGRPACGGLVGPGVSRFATRRRRRCGRSRPGIGRTTGRRGGISDGASNRGGRGRKGSHRCTRRVRPHGWFPARSSPRGWASKRPPNDRTATPWACGADVPDGVESAGEREEVTFGEELPSGAREADVGTLGVGSAAALEDGDALDRGSVNAWTVRTTIKHDRGDATLLTSPTRPASTQKPSGADCVRSPKSFPVSPRNGSAHGQSAG